MSALDRAFIKAYAEWPATNVPAPGAPEPGSQAPPARHPSLAHAVLGSMGATSTAPRAASPLAAHTVRATAPLSAFSPPAKEPSARSSIEIDELSWPRTCCDLLTHAKHRYEQFADLLVERQAQGQRRIAIVGCAAGDGCTTIALATAKLLGARGIRTVVVDANTDAPTLAECCRITAQAGWTEVVEGQRTLEEALITAAADGAALLPCRGRSRHGAHTGDPTELAVTMAALEEQFELILLDTAPLANPAAIAGMVSLAETVGLDAVYVVRNVRRGDHRALTAACARLARAGVHVAGTIDNFADPAELPGPALGLRLPKLAGRLLASRG
jgi:Mrp family chromosome partitioning ATPase